MILEILNKILHVLFFISILNIVRICFFLIGSFIKSEETQPEKFRLGRTSLILLGLSLSYILTVFVTGMNIL